MKQMLDRSRIGSLKHPHICIMTLRGRLKKVRGSSPITVAADAKGYCYASHSGTTFERMLDDGYLEIVGTYNKECPESVMWDDIEATAKECGIRG